MDDYSNNEKSSDDRNFLLLAAFAMCGVSIASLLIMFSVMCVKTHRNLNNKNNEDQSQEDKKISI